MSGIDPRSFVFPFLLGAMAWGGPATAQRIDQDEALRLRQSDKILPLEYILQQALQAQPGRVIEIELERADGRPIYELEVLDTQGRIWELYLDATTGSLLEHERED
ncbi:Peptidase propeptide and YPEB domain-containing protein [Modicisalibacter ilicicola DSM 19980]|uniref:Peptidase propeptide and YPEB domain-containing protein n=1 Tax=Modicisalibacter ilicicola DSM 19980 TaxID=1121942 RepID=A0A1M5CW21_9GAMM|nr:PepSY domain-containing protein [Halomonas ilicicola]SHF58970.1 Peptidase propeptide and YPEB domain-containing protein [Halomonas ilicicola DSM 19980]